MPILINIIILRWLFFSTLVFKGMEDVADTILSVLRVYLCLYLPSTYMIWSGCGMYVYVTVFVNSWRCLFIEHLSIYSLVTNSSDKLVTRCVLRARFMLVVMKGFNIRWVRVVSMITCATLVLGCPGYTRASEYIYIFLPFIENSSFLIKLKWDTLSYVTKGGLWEYLVWCYEETKCNGSSLYTCTYILSRCSFIWWSTPGLVWCRFATSYETIGYE